MREIGDGLCIDTWLPGDVTVDPLAGWWWTCLEAVGIFLKKRCLFKQEGPFKRNIFSSVPDRLNI